MAEIGDIRSKEGFVEKKKYKNLAKVLLSTIPLCICLTALLLFFIDKQNHGLQESMENFAVSSVKKEKAKFKVASLNDYADVVAEYWKSKNRKEKQRLNFEVGQVNQRNLVDPTSMEPRPEKHHEIISHKHGFISTVLTAYSNHLALVLSPDDFWLLISLGIGQFLGGNPKMAEKYRHTFVNHTGKKELVVNVKKYGIEPKNPHSNEKGWPMAIEEMTELIGKETATNISSIMTVPFSTTGIVEQTVMRTTLMESMKNYFHYRFNILCGIPEITLEGNASDYRSLVDRVDELTVILPDFAWYLNRVRKHLVKIYETKMGNVDNAWWRNMVVYTPPKNVICGTEPGRFTGWLTDFIAFTSGRDGKLVNNKREMEVMDFADCNTPAVTITDFVLSDLIRNKTYKMVLSGGFVGVALDEKRVDAVRPAIGWMTFYKE